MKKSALLLAVPLIMGCSQKINRQEINRLNAKVDSLNNVINSLINPIKDGERFKGKVISVDEYALIVGFNNTGGVAYRAYLIDNGKDLVYAGVGGGGSSLFNKGEIADIIIGDVMCYAKKANYNREGVLLSDKTPVRKIKKINSYKPK